MLRVSTRGFSPE